MKKYRYSGLKKIVNAFTGKKVLVVGDLLLDKFIWGDVSRISPEAPVPVVAVRREDHMPGGACNVAHNIASTGAGAVIAGAVGDDDEAKLLMKSLEARGIDHSAVVTDPACSTIVKTRVIAHQQQVVRIDREKEAVLDKRYSGKMMERIANIISDVDAIIIEDYGKGVITPPLIKKILPLARKYGKLVAVDPKEDHFSYYKGVDIITPNHHEAHTAAGLKPGKGHSIEKVGERLLRRLGCKVVLITLGEEGMLVCRNGRPFQKIPTLAKEVYDVSGAGDTVVAMYTLSMISGATPMVAAHIANCAAGIVVGKVGVATVGREELLDRLKDETDGRLR